ncbi:hypothetical protein HBI43_053230 [Parastagonospora nodorum]|nr:hypothetical protein HBI43_053230 [Parastagonospora nodorum]
MVAGLCSRSLDGTKRQQHRAEGVIRCAADNKWAILRLLPSSTALDCGSGGEVNSQHCRTGKPDAGLSSCPTPAFDMQFRNAESGMLRY